MGSAPGDRGVFGGGVKKDFPEYTFYRNFNKKSFTNQTEYGIIENNQFLCFPDHKNRNGDTE